jgi:hypothetical protein
MTPSEIARVFDWYSAEISQNATFQQEMHHHWSTLCQDLKDKPSSLSDAFILADPDYYSSIREIFSCFEASKALEQNNNGRGQTKRTSIITYSQRRKCRQGQNTRQIRYG